MVGTAHPTRLYTGDNNKPAWMRTGGRLQGQNEHGLFDTRLWAQAYLKEYALHGEEYGDIEWDLVYVVRVLPSGAP